ncbi:hypothetical protein CS063_12665 [Sporanaerobium hydrogeniformans]|uniref:Uncharacterized protein n=1 Tax=Sporanaerobium hydrogeniformans TaxID=3072179 RepID=A0AC61D9Q3_9FIRM|nr:hypothetical protein CS063_12665 [Sporanaerobium hydrogeniformans]
MSVAANKIKKRKHPLNANGNLRFLILDNRSDVTTTHHPCCALLFRQRDFSCKIDRTINK